MHVLVCDDDRESAESLAALLRLVAPVPVIVDVGFDGRQAVDMARGAHPDVVILDLEMPSLNGLDAAAEIRKESGGTMPLLIAVSGAPAHLSSADVGHAFDHALLKPIDCDILLRLVFGD